MEHSERLEIIKAAYKRMMFSKKEDEMAIMADVTIKRERKDQSWKRERDIIREELFDSRELCARMLA